VRYEAILFDFDGVLADSEPVHFECWQEILRTYGLQLDWQTYLDHGIGKSDRLLLSMLCNQSDPPMEIERLVAEYPRKKEMFRTRMLAHPAISDEVIELVRDLHDYQLAVVTSSGQTEVEPVLIQAGIRDLFHATVFGGDVKRHKPAPDPYLLAVEKLGVRRALVVEDSDAGEASARAAGLEVLRISVTADMPGLLRDALALDANLPG
jgi:HAD superfamily hydrolase (TIGR01509 family)